MLFRVLLVLAGFSFATGHSLAHDLSKAPQKPRKAAPPETLQVIELGKEIPGLSGRQLRMRKVILQPGGAIPPHSHANRPAVVYILQGRVREHRSDHKAPVEYGAGDSITEHAAVHHWIESIGDEPLIGIVVDIPTTKETPQFTAKQILNTYGLPEHEHK